jgi:hypothetical protein
MMLLTEYEISSKLTSYFRIGIKMSGAYYYFQVLFCGKKIKKEQEI